jgi:hypothetical protein
MCMLELMLILSTIVNQCHLPRSPSSLGEESVIGGGLSGVYKDSISKQIQ